ncbi:MAG: tRNA (guanosine(37)-N1)-methyltransferase TrmD [Nannocystaceae bacterium]
MSLTFEVFTLFPAAIRDFLRSGLLGKAQEAGLVEVHCTDYRDFTSDRHRTVDDTPYGGGAGMLMKAPPVVLALESVTAARGPMHRILVTPSAPRFDQRAAERLAQLPRIGLLCGRYEGIDDRVREHFVDECFSLGDFILNGGEIAALAIIEAVSRLREGVLHNPESIARESFAAGDEPDGAAAGQGLWLEHPSYTRPPEFRGHKVPEVLLGGDHPAIARWRAEAAWRRTWALRPDLRPDRRLAPDRPLLLAIDLGDRDDALPLRPHLDALAALGLPTWWIARRRAAASATIPHAPDRKALRRALRRHLGVAPRLVGLDLGGDPAAIPGAAPLLDRLDLTGDAAGTDAPIVLVLRGDALDPGRDLAPFPDRGPESVDALFALLPDSRASNGLELAPGARMIDSSQPRSAAEVVDLVAAAVARLRR